MTLDRVWFLQVVVERASSPGIGTLGGIGLEPGSVVQDDKNTFSK